MAAPKWTWILTFALASLGGLLVALPAAGADPAFVGKLSLAVDPEASKDLGLTDEVRSQLLALVDKRETDAGAAAVVTDGERPALSDVVAGQ